MCKQTLLKTIEDYREELLYLASHSSLSNERVIEISQKLDNLLNKYEHLNRNK